MASQYNGTEEALALGLRLRSARIKSSLTMMNLAEKLKMSHTQISRIERGKFKRTSKNVRNICTFLNVETQVTHLPSGSLQARIARIASTSPHWEKAVLALVEALESAQNDTSP